MVYTTSVSDELIQLVDITGRPALNPEPLSTPLAVAPKKATLVYPGLLLSARFHLTLVHVAAIDGRLAICDSILAAPRKKRIREISIRINV